MSSRGRGSGLALGPFVRILIPFMRAPLSPPRHLLESPPSDNSSSGLGSQHTNLEGCNHSVHSTTVTVPLPATWAPGLESSHFTDEAQRKLKPRLANSLASPLVPLWREASSLHSPHSRHHPSPQVKCHDLQADVRDPLRQNSGLPLSSPTLSPASRRARTYGSVTLFAHLPFLSVVGFLAFCSQGRDLHPCPHMNE